MKIECPRRTRRTRCTRHTVLANLGTTRLRHRKKGRVQILLARQDRLAYASALCVSALSSRHCESSGLTIQQILIWATCPLELSESNIEESFVCRFVRGSTTGNCPHLQYLQCASFGGCQASRTLRFIFTVVILEVAEELVSLVA